MAESFEFAPTNRPCFRQVDLWGDCVDVYSLGGAEPSVLYEGGRLPRVPLVSWIRVGASIDEGSGQKVVEACITLSGSPVGRYWTRELKETGLASWAEGGRVPGFSVSLDPVDPWALRLSNHRGPGARVGYNFVTNEVTVTNRQTSPLGGETSAARSSYPSHTDAQGNLKGRAIDEIFRAFLWTLNRLSRVTDPTRPITHSSGNNFAIGKLIRPYDPIGSHEQVMAVAKHALRLAIDQSGQAVLPGLVEYLAERLPLGIHPTEVYSSVALALLERQVLSVDPRVRLSANFVLDAFNGVMKLRRIRTTSTLT